MNKNLVKENNDKETIVESDKKKQKEKSKNDWGWVIKVTILSFMLSIIFSFLSDTAANNLPVVPAIIVLALVIFIGVIFDIIGVAVTVADESEFHAKATKKVKGAKESIKLIKNASQVSNICADVIGDICGVLSRCNKCSNSDKNNTKPTNTI